MKGKSHIDSQKEGFESLMRQLGDFKPDGPADHTVLVAKNFSPFLARAVQKAALEGVQSDRGLLVEPLSAFVYNDASHDMLTVTCIILEKRVDSAASIEVKDGQEAKLETETPLEIFLDESRLGSWSFLARAWDDVHRIAIPDLSMKERAAIHEKLNAPATDIQSAHASLRFRLGEDEKDSLKELEVYASHYRYYPSFLPVNM